jgi:thiol:disulfide interchange protein
MSARLISHITFTIVLFAAGWWLYMRLDDNSYTAVDSVGVATYWFAVLVYVLFSWFFYWIVHRLKLKAWVVAQIFAVVIAAVSTGALLFVSREHQKQLEAEAMQLEKSEEAKSSDEAQDAKSETKSEDKIQTLNLSEEEVNDAMLVPEQEEQ